MHLRANVDDKLLVGNTHRRSEVRPKHSRRSFSENGVRDAEIGVGHRKNARRGAGVVAVAVFLSQARAGSSRVRPKREWPKRRSRRLRMVVQSRFYDFLRAALPEVR